MRDVRLALRMLRATPVVTAVAVLSLALGIGANTAIFSLVNSLVLRSLPVADPQSLVTLFVGPPVPFLTPFSYASFDQIRRRNLTESVAAYSPCCSKTTLTVDGAAETIDREFVGGDFFATLGVRARAGRLLTPADDVPGGGPDGPVVVISDRLWQRRFGGSPAVVGRPVRIERLAVTIVGVTPPGFLGIEVGRGFDVALPIRIEPLVDPSIAFDDRIPWLNVLLRLKAGQSIDAATSALRAAQPQIRAGSLPREFPDTFLKQPFTLAPAATGRSDLRVRFETPLTILLGLVALVLLIACANMANLLLARGAARRHDLGVRVALGASPWQLARQSLAESALFSSAGAALGLLVAHWTVRAIVAQLSTSASAVVLDLSLDWRVLSFTAAAMIATTLVFGTMPALRAAHADPLDALNEQGRATAESTDRGAGGWAGGLIVAQVAVSLVLVVAAGLFGRTFERLARGPLGFDRDRTMTITVTAPTVAAADRNAFYHRLVQAAAATPGVVAAGGSLNAPLMFVLIGDVVPTTPGSPVPRDGQAVSQFANVTPGWLQAYGIGLRGGRYFDERDRATSMQAIIVNDAFVRRYFPGRDLVGAPLALTARLPSYRDIPLGTYTVVGVVADAAYRSVREPLAPTIYAPLAQRTDPLLYNNFYIVVRSSGASPAGLTRSIAAALNAVNADLKLTFQPMAGQVRDSIAQERLVALLAVLFGALALLLAALGLYGVTSYAVARRRTEIGIRMALGAAPADVVGLVLARVSRLVGLGIVVGVVASLWASRFIASLLYGLEPRDPATLAAAGVVLAGVAALAAWTPAHRAARIDPAQVLRQG